jgi:hypothetical protein
VDSLLSIANMQLSVNLSLCGTVFDVSELGYVHTLKKICCHEIKDISALGGGHMLDLSDCRGVTDVSRLVIYIL